METVLLSWENLEIDSLSWERHREKILQSRPTVASVHFCTFYGKKIIPEFLYEEKENNNYENKREKKNHFCYKISDFKSRPLPWAAASVSCPDWATGENIPSKQAVF